MNRHVASRSLAVLIVLLVAADWLSKLWITNQLALGETRALVEGWLYFTHRENTGVAFSMFSDLPPTWGVWFLSGLSLLGVILFSRIITSHTDHLARLAAAMVVAGALGNMGNRLWTGAVTDFVFLAFFPFVFNFADAAITLGGSVLAVRLATATDPVAPAAITSGGGAG